MRMMRSATSSPANAEAHYQAARPTILAGTIAKPPSKPLSSTYDPKRDVLVNYTPLDPSWRKNHILPKWGDQPLSAIEPQPVQLWLRGLRYLDSATRITD